MAVKALPELGKGKPPAPLKAALEWLLPAHTLAYTLFLLTLSFLPWRFAFRIVRHVGTLRYKSRRPMIALDAGLVPLLSADAIEPCVKRSFQMAASEDLEAALYPRVSRGNMRRLIQVRGLEHLDAALARGKGAILYSGHVRGHHTFYAVLALLGYRVNVAGRGPGWGHGVVERWFYEWRDRVIARKFGCRFLRMEEKNIGVAVHALNALRRNEVVTMAIDKTVSPQAVTVRFLHGFRRFPSGAATLALTSGAPLLTFYLHRTDEWLPEVAEIGEPFWAAGDIERVTQHCAFQLEEKIRLEPASWYGVWSPRWRLGGKHVPVTRELAHRRALDA